MPPLPSPPVPVVRVQWKHSLGEDMDVLTRSYFEYSGTAPTGAQLATMAASIVASWPTYLQALCYSQVKIEEVICTDIATDLGAQGTAAGSATGSRLGYGLAAGTCAVIEYHIARRYRGGKPRVYLPFGVAEDLNDAQTWGSTQQTAFQAGWASTIGVVETAIGVWGTSVGLVNVSYYQGFASYQNPITLRWKNAAKPRVTPLVDAVVSTTCSPIVGSQRRRNRAGS